MSERDEMRREKWVEREQAKEGGRGGGGGGGGEGLCTRPGTKSSGRGMFR